MSIVNFSQYILFDDGVRHVIQAKQKEVKGKFHDSGIIGLSTGQTGFVFWYNKGSNKSGKDLKKSIII